MSEFEDRENYSTLNELPEILGDERREREGYTLEGTRFDLFGTSPPADIAQQALVKGAPGKVGSVPLGFMVTSTYDARPVNARDFLFTGSITSFMFGCTQVNTAELLFTVPNGYVAVIKGFKYEWDPVLALASDGVITATLISDNVNVLNYTAIQVPQIINDFIPAYALCNPGKQVGLELTHPQPVNPSGSGQDAATAYIEIYGNLLLAQGYPVQYEPANRIL